MASRAQLSGVSLLLPPHGSRGLNSGPWLGRKGLHLLQPPATTVKELKQNLRCDRPRDSRLCCSRVSLLAFCAVFVLGSSELKAGAGKQWRVHRVSLTSITRRAPHSEGLLSERELFVRHPWKPSLVVEVHYPLSLLNPHAWIRVGHPRKDPAAGYLQPWTCSLSYFAIAVSTLWPFSH